MGDYLLDWLAVSALGGPKSNRVRVLHISICAGMNECVDACVHRPTAKTKLSYHQLL